MNMQKPKKSIKEVYDFNEVMDYLEHKYNFDHRDYKNSHEHFGTWLNLKQEKKPTHPISLNGKMYLLEKEITKEEWDKIYKEIHEQYARYKNWCVENPEPPYLDFWHWLTDHDFSNVRNGCIEVLYIKYWLNKLSDSDWQKEILQYIYNEFQEDEMEFWIEW